MDGDNNVVLTSFKFIIFIFLLLFLLCCRFDGSEPLVLALHVALLGFFGFREEFFYVYNVHKGTGKVVAFTDGL